jgi:hypothetical protein
MNGKKGFWMAMIHRFDVNFELLKEKSYPLLRGTLAILFAFLHP